MRTSSPIYDLFDDQDKQFLERMFSTHPKIADSFDRYLSMNQPQRLMTALADVKALKRAGWVKRGVLYPESVADHSFTAAKFARAYAPNDARMDVSKLSEMLIVHDLPEVIATDFMPTDPIAPEDKHRLEWLAARVICQEHVDLPGASDSLALIKEYIDQQTPTSHWAHDADKLDAVITAIMYEGMYPAQKGKLYRPFAEYTAPRLKTEQGRAVMAELDQRVEAIRDDWRARTRESKEKITWGR